MELKAQIGDLLYELSKDLKDLTDQKLKHLNIGQGQLLMLLFLMRMNNDSGLYQEQIAKKMKLNKANVSRNIKKLEQKGLVIVKTDTEDIRKQFVQITPEGLELKGIISSIFITIQKEITKDIHPEDLHTTSDTLTKMIQNLSEYSKKEKE